MLVRDLDVPLLARKKGWRCWKKQALPIAQNHLVERVVKLNRDFNLLNLAVAGVLDGEKHVRHFLIQEIRGPAHFGLEKMNL